MGEQIPGTPGLDKDLDPQVIRRRTFLFNKYVMPYRNMIYRLCMDYSFDSSNVEENYTEVLVNFYRRIETYDPTRSIKTWLHIVTKRQVWALEKKRLAALKKDFDNDIEDLGESIIDEAGTSGNVMGIDNYRELYNDDILEVLDQLKPCYKNAFLLQEAGYSLKEIAEIEYASGSLKSKNIETVKSRLRIARQHLKEHLTRDGNKRIPD